MKRATVNVIAAGLLAVGLVACKGSDVTPNPPAPPPPPVTPPVSTEPAAPAKYFTGNVAETMNAGGYTYVQVDNGKEKIWAAAPQFEIKKGDKVNVPEGMPMKDYESKTLNRKFDVVYFVGAIGKGDALPPAAPPSAPGVMPTDQTQMPPEAHPKVDPNQLRIDANVKFDGIKKAEKSVGELFDNQSSLGGKEVSVRGKVVKFSPQIMGKNWVHVQDGTGKDGGNDLTVTTADVVKVGDTVLVTGKVTLKKDFGMGYKYDLIIEDGKVKAE